MLPLRDILSGPVASPNQPSLMEKLSKRLTPADRFKSLTGDSVVRSDLRSRSIRAIGFTGIAGFADLVLRLASTAILARLLSPEQFGIVMMASAVIAIADQFRDLGLSTATVQKIEITV